MPAKRSVLITGITGFTGKYLREALGARGYEVRGIADRGVDRPGDRVVDLLDRAALQAALTDLKPHYVVHLAGVAFAAHDRPDDFHRVHQHGTRNLLESIAQTEAPVRKVILASSAYVYGRPPAVPVEEAVPPAPVNAYGDSKLKMEQLAREWFDRLPILIARPFNYTGVGQSINFVLPKIVSHFRQKAAEIELADTSVVREFSDVRDVCEIYVRLLESGARSDVVNLCSGNGHVLQAVFERLCTLSGFTPTIRRSRALERRNEIPELIGSPKKLHKALGQLSFRPLDETLSWMLRG